MARHYEWDETKRRSNLRKHKLDFAYAWMAIEHLDLLTWEDDRADYGETRFVGIGPIGSRLVVVVYTERGDVVRVISLRKALKHEKEAYKKRFGKA